MNCSCTEKCRNPTENVDITINTLEIPLVLYEAICIFNGRYGNGEDREQNLIRLGYSLTDIKKIQECVNTISPYYEKLTK